MSGAKSLRPPSSGTRATCFVWVVLAAFLAAGCDPPDRPAEVQAAIAPEAEPVTVVETARIRRGQIVQRIVAAGTLVARRESLIGTEVQGRIEAVYVSEGDRVEQGEPLFSIDPQLFEIAHRRAQAALERVQAERRQIESDLLRAKRLQRKNVVAEQELERLFNAAAIAKTAEREAVEALALAKRNLEHTVVRAPYSGSVAKRLADEGTTALVQPQTIVIVFQETTSLEAHAMIPEVHFAAIQTGDAALLYVVGLALPIQVDVTAVADSVDLATRSFLVVMKVANPDYKLKAGVFARVEILPKAKGDVLLVPRAALRREEGRTFVLAVKDGRVVEAHVTLGIIGEDFVEVLRGVREGDEVVIGNAARTLGPGMRVRAMAEEEAPAS